MSFRIAGFLAAFVVGTALQSATEGPAPGHVFGACAVFATDGTSAADVVYADSVLLEITQPSGKALHLKLPLRYMNRSGAAARKACTRTRGRGWRRRTPMTGRGQVPYLHDCYKGKRRIPNIAYERRTGRRNGFGTGVFPFATKPGGWCESSELRRKSRNENATNMI
jgi:hypothetical protein